MVLEGGFSEARGRDVCLRSAHPADEEGNTIDEGKEVLDEEDGRFIRPVEVLEDEDEGTVARESFKETAGGEIDLFAHGLAVEVLEVLPEFSFHLEADEACEVGEDLSAVSREECGDLCLRTSPRPPYRCRPR